MTRFEMVDGVRSVDRRDHDRTVFVRRIFEVLDDGDINEPGPCIEVNWSGGGADAYRFNPDAKRVMFICNTDATVQRVPIDLTPEDRPWDDCDSLLEACHQGRV